MIAVARADQERDQVAGLDGDILDRADRHLVRALRDAGGKPLPHRPAPQLERPGDAVAALGMRVLHLGAIRSTALTGLFQPAATRKDGDGCMATLCGFRLPGIRTC